MNEENNKKRKIMFVDDDKMILDMYNVKFAKAGYDIRSVVSTEQALKVIHDGFLPEVLLIDILMPGMDGLELVAKIKNEKLLPDSIFIMLSNNSSTDDIARAKRLNVDSFIIKASTIPSEVLEEVRKMLEAKDNKK
jgi:CheY-like chemotaxis protein